jgi:electron transfer flavoprotein beta subunit
MNIIVLLSAGLHPVSGRTCPVPVELQAIGLANRLLEQAETVDDCAGASRVRGLHAGAVTPSIEDCLGHGLREIVVLEQPADKLAAVEEVIRNAAPDVVLTGRRGRGGEDSGQLPYRLAASLGWPICADAIAIQKQGRSFAVTQALPRGARRRVIVPLPALVSVHPAAPAGPVFTFAAVRRGKILVLSARGTPCKAPAGATEHPYRPRPRLVRGANFSGSAEDRLKAATEISGSGKVMINPLPEEAAEAICTFLQKLGLLRADGVETSA